MGCEASHVLLRMPCEIGELFHNLQCPVRIETFLYPVETDPVQLEVYMAAIASGNVRYVCACVSMYAGVLVCVHMSIMHICTASPVGSSGAQSFTSLQSIMSIHLCLIRAVIQMYVRHTCENY